MQPRKQHLIDTAFRLFNEFGYHATGIDRILAASGVSKATLYKHFRSKEQLILAVLEQRQGQWLERLTAAMDAAGAKRGAAVLILFDELDEWFHSEDFYGCNFIHASAEYAQEDADIQAFAAAHKEKVFQLILDHLPGKGKKARAELAAQLALLADGAIVQAHTRGNKHAAKLAKKIAEQLLAVAQL